MNFFTIIAVILLTFSCSSNTNFYSCIDNNISIKNDVLYLNGKIDTSCVKLTFDTGCLIGCLIPDSTALRIIPDKMVNSEFDEIRVIRVDSISICKNIYGSNNVNVIRGFFSPQIAPIYESDDRIWHLNLDSMRLSIDYTPSDYQDKLVFPIVFTERKGKKNAPMVNIPITYSQNGITIETNYYYLLDTGTPYGCVMTDPPVEMKEFVDRIKHISLKDEMSAKIKNRIIEQFELNFGISDMLVNGVLCEFDTAIRSFDLEFGKKFEHVGKPLVGTIGMRFLKHFNFDIDLQNQLLVLSPNKSVFPSKPHNKNGFWCNKDGVVRRIEVDGIAYQNGLRIGDTITLLDNNPFVFFTQGIRDSIIYHSNFLELQLSNGRRIQLNSN